MLLDYMIPVTAQMPEHRIDVLCFQPETKDHLSDRTFDARFLTGHTFYIEPGEMNGRIDRFLVGDRACNIADGGCFWTFPYICHQNFVTHWMPLDALIKDLCLIISGETVGGRSQDNWDITKGLDELKRIV